MPSPSFRKLLESKGTLKAGTFIGEFTTPGIDQIAAVEGVDCLWIGHFDLSCSLGIPGQFDHPEFVAALEQVITAGKTHNKPLGRLVPTVEEGVTLFKEGFDMILYSMDVGLLRQALTSGVEALRSQCGL